MFNGYRVPVWEDEKVNVNVKCMLCIYIYHQKMKKDSVIQKKKKKIVTKIPVNSVTALE